jgi:hypothetical protein
MEKPFADSFPTHRDRLYLCA